MSEGNPKPVCTICIEDLKPIVDDLQIIPICGHVFHELCIQQWMEYCPPGKKPSCPVCKQSCSRDGLTRLFFPSTGDSAQIAKICETGNEKVAVEELKKEVRRLEAKVLVLSTNFEGQKDCIKKLNNEVSVWKEIAKKEEARNRELRKEKEIVGHHLTVANQELSRKSTECTKLQERSLALAKELAALKLATDLNLEEEEMVKLASIGHGKNPENVIDVLKKSLSIRNKSYKELMTQCNSLGRSESRVQQKLDKSKEKIKKLNTRLQELEKALEDKANQVLRNLKTSYRENGKDNKKNSVDHSTEYAYENEVQNALPYITSKENEVQNVSIPIVPKEIDVVDLETGSCFLEENTNGYIESPLKKMKCSKNEHPGNMVPRKVAHITSSTWQTETLIIDDISKQTPSVAVKHDPQVYESNGCTGSGLFGAENGNKNLGKWLKSSTPNTSTNNGNLISVGSDGRGGRVKVLRDHSYISEDRALRLFPKKLKNGAKPNGQFFIENFFKKTES